jgi:hypothetical protein
MQRRRFFLALLTAAVIGQPALAHDFKSGRIELKHPWSRVAPPVAPVLGGYVTIINTGSEPDRLIGGSSVIAGKFEVHESTLVDGVTKMRPLKDGLVINPGQTVDLQPGGTHIMFVSPTSRPAEGQKFVGTLVFEKAGTINVEFAVEGMGKAPAKAEDHSKHGK